jgi:carboxymethylenebutenolidase
MADMTLPLPSKAIDGYLATPSTPGPHPAVIVIHEAFGLNSDIRRIADRFASEGYLAIAPDLLEGGKVTCIAQAMRTLQKGEGPLVDMAEQVADWLEGRNDVIPGRIGVTGFCMGGGFAYLLGLTGKVRAIAPNYGQPPPSDRLEQSCPVVASYGGRDRMFAKYASQVEETLTRAEVAHDVKSYPDAGHSFMNRPEGHIVMKALSRPLIRAGYRQDSAEDAWRRILAFFAEHV